MTMTILRRGATALALCSLATVVAGCNDGLVCQSEIITIDTPIETSSVPTQRCTETGSWRTIRESAAMTM